MHAFVWIAAVLGVAAARKDFVVARGGGKVLVTAENTLNGTTTAFFRKRQGVQAGNLPLNFVNNYGEESLYAYIQGQDSNGAVLFVDANGNSIYPSASGSSVPVEITDDIAIPIADLGDTTSLTLPITMNSGRIYFSEGELIFYVVTTPIGEGIVQPVSENINGINGNLRWGYIELTYTTDLAVYVNISYVDFVGMIFGIMLSSINSASQTAKGLLPDAFHSICSDLTMQTSTDGWPWSGECIANENGELIRVLSPLSYQSIDDSYTTAFNGYWSDYVDQVWYYYSSNMLIIDTQDPVYNEVTCQVIDDLLHCGDGDNLAYPKPTDNDIWGCSTGTFDQNGGNELHLLIIPRLCAAFTRSTLLLAGGNVQPGLEDYYYSINPTSHYAKAIHEYERDHKGYAFPYDDVHPDGGIDSSGLLSTDDPESLTVYIGGSQF